MRCLQLAGVDVADLMRVGEAALTDASAREQLIHRVTDAALEFLLSVLPNLPVPPIEGVREGVAYNISELDLTGVKLQKQDVQVVVGDHSAIAGETDSMHIAIVNIGCVRRAFTVPSRDGGAWSSCVHRAVPQPTFNLSL